MACVEARDARNDAARDALSAVRSDMSRDPNYDAGRYLGLCGEPSVVTSIGAMSSSCRQNNPPGFDPSIEREMTDQELTIIGLIQRLLAIFTTDMACLSHLQASDLHTGWLSHISLSYLKS